MDLSGIDLFSSLNYNELKKISEIAKRMHFGRGEIIFNEGDFEKNIYIIESGQVEIFKKHPIHGEQILTVLKNGDYFGEMAFFEKNSIRSATARTIQATVLIVIESKDFDVLLHNHPSISLKLLSTLSQRLRDTTQNISKVGANIDQRVCKVVSVASAKDGYGKSTIAVSLAKLISRELDKKVLFFDLDFYFGSGSQLLGIHSPRSIIDIIHKMNLSEENITSYNEYIKFSDNLFAIPAPRSFLEAETIKSSDILRLLKIARKQFDYIIIDTGSNFNEYLFTALDTTDFILFLVNCANITSISDNVRFFQGISKLSYPKNKVFLLASNIGPDFSTSKMQKVFPYKLIGGLPNIPSYIPEFGKPPYDTQPNSPYCEVIRLIIKNIFKENLLKSASAKNGFLAKFFGNNNNNDIFEENLDIFNDKGENSFKPIISSKDVRSQVKYVRYNLLFGYLTEAKKNILTFMEYSQAAAPLCELLGEIYLLEDLPGEALEAFQKAVSLEPEQHLALAYLGLLTASLDKYNRAINILQQKIEKNPHHLDLLNDYGKILMKNKEYDKALIQFSRALDGNPSYLEAKINYSICLAKLNKTNEAIKQLLDVKNKNPRIYCTLGNILYDDGRLYLAYKAYNKAITMYPEYPGIRPVLTELSNYLRKLESVIDLHERFVSNNPAFPDLHAKLANFYHLAGKTSLAIEEYKKALELNKNYKEAELKLEAIEKDKIWKIASKCLISNESDEFILASDNFKLNVNFICHDKSYNLPTDALLQIKNIRTGKVMQEKISNERLRYGNCKINCSDLGFVAAQDVLLVQLVSESMKTVNRSSPYYIESKHLKENMCTVDFVLGESCKLKSNYVGIKYFVIYLTLKHLAKLISCEYSQYKVLAENLNNRIEADGFINPENNDQINFVLKADETKKIPAASVGDEIAIKITDTDDNEVFSTSFTVIEEDVKAFCKKINVENS